METTLIIFLSVIFGISQKLADAVNEHETHLFKGANILFGLMFGVSGFFLSNFNTDFSIFFIGLVIYWLLSNKLDYFNHKLSASIILLGILFTYNPQISDLLNVIFVIGLFFLLKEIKRQTMNISNLTAVMFKYRLQHMFAALVLGLWFNSFYLSLSILCTIITILLTIRFLKSMSNYKEII